MTDPELTRRLAGAHEATRHVAYNVDAVQLFTEGARAAEHLPEPLGVAVAGVLAMAAYERSLTGRQGSLGASEPTMALALAALAWMPAAEEEEHGPEVDA